MGRFLGSVLSRAAQIVPGTHIPHHKETAGLATERMPLPTQVILPMKQHVGAPCTPQVKRRQHVDVGTLIGHSDAKMSADIHSSVSGTVKDIRPIHYSNGGTTTAVVIEPDGEQSLDPTLEAPEVTDYQSLMAAVARAGIVGLGGAGFPTALKMDTDLTNIDLWLVNGAECEPYLSSDCREMVEYPERIVGAIARCLDLSGVKRSLICVEDNKQEAIGLLRKACERDPRIDVHVLPATYPQGASRVILANVVGKSVPRGGHLTDVGALLFNVTTMSEIGRYLTDGIPLKRIHWRYSRRYHPFKTDAYYNWIEGVGPDRNFILPIPFTFNRTGNKFISCYDQGERIYHIGEELESSSVINLPLKHEFKAGYEDSVSPDSVWIEYASNNVITLFIVGAKSDYQFRIEDHSSVPPISSSFNKHQSNCCLSIGHMCNGMNSVTIENEYESYTASFLFPFDQHTSVTAPSDKSSNSKFLDLSGRRLPSLPTQKGIYIKDGRKVLIK